MKKIALTLLMFIWLLSHLSAQERLLTAPDFRKVFPIDEDARFELQADHLTGSELFAFKMICRSAIRRKEAETRKDATITRYLENSDTIFRTGTCRPLGNGNARHMPVSLKKSPWLLLVGAGATAVKSPGYWDLKNLRLRLEYLEDSGAHRHPQK